MHIRSENEVTGMDAKKIKPFPWVCADCRTKTVTPVRRDYELTSQHDGLMYEIAVKNVDVPTCSTCGQAVVTSELCEQITDELRKRVGLLGPVLIQAKREAIGMTQAEIGGRIANSGDDPCSLGARRPTPVAGHGFAVAAVPGLGGGAEGLRPFLE